MGDIRNAASGSRWGEWEGVDIERLLADVDATNAQHYEDIMPTGQETRVIDPKTGGAKGSKLARFDLVPADVMVLLAEHYGRGARKYEDRNWEKGYDWGLSYAALQRHLAAFWQGDDIDYDPSLYEDGEDPTALHIVAALWHCVALTAFLTRGIGTDTRPCGP